MIEPIPVRVFNYEVNANFAKATLLKSGIESDVRETEQAQYELLVDSIAKNKALPELDKLNLDETPVHKDSEGYLEELDEWSKHMYNPVYYLEHKKLPHFFYNKSTKRVLGLTILLPGLAVFLLSPQNRITAGMMVICGFILTLQSFGKKE